MRHDIATAISAVILAGTLAGCGVNGTDETTAPAEITAQETVAAAPEVVGMALDAARNEIEDAGFDISTRDTREDRAVLDESNWVVLTQETQGKTVMLGVEKYSDAEADAATEGATADVVEAESASSAASRAEALELALKSAFGLSADEDLSSLLAWDANEWPGYVSGVRFEGDLAYITLQIANDDPGRNQMGERAAKAISTLICEADATDISWYVVEDASGVVIAQETPRPLC